MNDTLAAPRVTDGAPAARSGAEREAAAMAEFARDFGRTAALYLESCIHCGSCAAACPFYLATDDARYTPVWKLEPFKRAYQREAGPLAWLRRALSHHPSPGAAELEEWQELIYDSCTVCGRCTLACPMGIDIASLVSAARHGMAAAGLVPPDLWSVNERAQREGSPLGATPKVLAERIAWLSDEYEIAMPLDLPHADVLVTLSSIEIMKYPRSLVAMARVMEHVGCSWTISSHGYEATNFGLLAGDRAAQRALTLRLVEAAEACGARLVILPECGHAYGALRWQGAEVVGRALPFDVLHISEFIAHGLAEGRIHLSPARGSVTFHDPCQISRRGGATAAPRAILRALGVELREPEDTGDYAFCCGGGGGVIANHRADALRRRAFAIRLAQIEATGADRAFTSCANCRQAFDDGGAFYHWEGRMGSLLELVAEHLVPAPTAALLAP